jgi:hypothetical protein
MPETTPHTEKSLELSDVEIYLKSTKCKKVVFNEVTSRHTGGEV